MILRSKNLKFEIKNVFFKDVSKTASQRRSFPSTRGPSQLESLQRKIWSRTRTLLSRRKGMVEVRLSVCTSVSMMHTG